MEGARFYDPMLAKAFCLAGNAYLTIKATKSGKHLTYRIRKPGEDTPHFVSVLTGQDNETSYTFLGSIFRNVDYRHGKKSRIGEDAMSERVFAWAWDAIIHNQMPDSIEVWHDGRCGRCGRKLTVPESIAAGIGPVCEGRE